MTEPSFDDVLQQMRDLFGEVHLGKPVAASVIDRVERELGVKFPADYRAFVAEYGYASAGRHGTLVVFGIAPDDIELDHVVDVRAATRTLRSELASRGNDAAAGAVVPVIGDPDNFPSEDVYVVDENGDVRCLLVEEHSPGEPLGFSFTMQLADHIEALHRRKSRRELLQNAPQALAHEDDGDNRYLRPLPAAVAQLLERSPILLETILLYDTRAEVKDVWIDEDTDDPHLEDVDGDGIAAEEVPPSFAHDLDEDDESLRLDEKERAIHALCAAPGIDDHAPLVGEPIALEDDVGVLVYNVTGLDLPAALAKGEIIARAVSGDHGIPPIDPDNKDERPTFLISADDVRQFASVLATLVDDVCAGYSELDERNLSSSLEDLIELAERVAHAYRDAAARGDAMLVRYAPYL